MTAVVFLGPSLGWDEARAILPGAVLLPPARQGDVFRAVRDHAPAAIGLVDGAFLDVPAVWHREILWAMEQGVAVLGAASMGALRAAELHVFGMQGVGRIFAAYRDGVLAGWDEPFEDDDEVAVVHAPAELGFRALSVAMVDVRAMLERAEADGAIGRRERDGLAGQMKSLHFPRRRVDVLAAMAPAGLQAWLATGAGSLKAEDARQLLHALPGEQAAPMEVRMERVLTWERFMAEAGTGDDGAAVLGALAEDPAAWREVARAAVGRVAALDVEAAGVGTREALDRFRTERGLLQRRDLDGWMAENAADAAGLVALLDRQARLDAMAEQWDGPALREAMLDVLRLSGRYAGLRRAG